MWNDLAKTAGSAWKHLGAKVVARRKWPEWRVPAAPWKWEGPSSWIDVSKILGIFLKFSC